MIDVTDAGHKERRMIARGWRGTVALVGLLLVLGCEGLQSPNVNSSDLDDLVQNPTRTKIANAITGVLAGNRTYIAGGYDYVMMTGVLGRNAYRLDIAEPRTITEWLEGSLNPASERGGGNIWPLPYENVRLSEIVLNAIDEAPTTEMSEGEKDASRGVVQTSRALDLLIIVNTRDSNCDGQLGCPIDVNEDAGTLAAPATKREVFDEILRLLDEGAANLQSAASQGASFIADMPPGYGDFTTPGTYLTFNRALAGRVLTYMGEEFDSSFWQQALTALDASFMDESRPMTYGAYYDYAASAGDLQNALYDPGQGPNIRAHPSLASDVEMKENGEPDDRYQRKVRNVEFFQLRGIGSGLAFDLYHSPSDGVPIIRNEELFLLRAEANIGLGNLEAARQDINFVREVSGGLASVGPFADRDAALDQLFYEKRYSLLFEGGHRWIDLRRWGRLDRLPIDRPDHVVNARFPVPTDEQIAR